MNKFLKLVAKIVGLLLVVYVILMVLVFFLVHPDTYKPLITKAFYKATGRQITIDGKMELSLFPAPSLQVKQIIIANRKGFKAPKAANYFAKIGSAQVQLKFFPLLKGKIRPSKLLLSKASINLITTASGKNNWNDLLNVKKTTKSNVRTNSHLHKVSAPSTTNTPPPSASMVQVKAASTNIPIIIISRSDVHFINLQTHRTTDITNLALRTKHIGKGNIYSLEIGCLIRRNNPNILIKLHIKSTTSINLPMKYYRFDKLKITTELLQFNKAERPITLKLTGDLTSQNQILNSSFHGFIRNQDGKVTLTLKKKRSRINLALSITQIPIDPIFTAFAGKSVISGILNFNAQLSTRGNNFGAWLKRLNGKGKFSIKNGAIYGLDLQYLAVNALQGILFNQKITAAPSEDSKTSFNEVSATYQIRNGTVSSKNILIDGDQIKANGGGTINLPNETINLKILATYTPKSQWQIPILITGNLFSPTVRPDTGALTKQLFKSKIQQDIEKTIKGLNLRKLFD